MDKKRSLLVTVALIGFGIVMLNCGSDNHLAQPPTDGQIASFAFMQEDAADGVFRPMLGSFSLSGGNERFSAAAVKDARNGQPLALVFYSINLGRDGKKAAIDGSNGSGSWDIWVLNIADGTMVRISNDDYVDAMPQLSPDGTKVVYASERPMGSEQYQIIIRNADGSGGEQVLPAPFGASLQWAPTYSPDGTKIAMQAYGIDSNDVPFSGIWIMNADGSDPQMLTNPLYSESCYACHDFNPAFNSDGSKISFGRYNFEGRRGEDIYVINTDGSGVMKLTDGLGYNADPMFVMIAGREKVIFTSNRDNLATAPSPGFELYSMEKDGTGITRLTTNSMFDAFSAEYYGLQIPWLPNRTQKAN